MKKINLILLGLLVILVVAGCKSEPTPQELLLADSEIPDFIANPPISDEFLFGVGSARLGNQTESMRLSDARARTDLAMKLDVEVQSMLIDYSRIAGTENNLTSNLTFYENVSRQLTQANMSGIEVVQRGRSSDGTWWTLSRLDKHAAARLSADIIENEASLYAEWRAMEALRMMEYQLGLRE